MARVCIQKEKNDGSVEALSVSFNRSTRADGAMHDPVLSQSARCLGPMCACWKPSAWNLVRLLPIIGYFYTKRGKCGLRY
jgi:hypothetical protein